MSEPYDDSWVTNVRAFVMRPKAEDDALRARVAELEKVLRGYEQWEGAVIMSDECWPQGSPWPVIKDEHHDRMMELQSERNAVLRVPALAALEAGDDK